MGDFNWRDLVKPVGVIAGVDIEPFLITVVDGSTIPLIEVGGGTFSALSGAIVTPLLPLVLLLFLLRQI